MRIRSSRGAALGMLEVIYHSTQRDQNPFKRLCRPTDGDDPGVPVCGRVLLYVHDLGATRRRHSRRHPVLHHVRHLFVLTHTKTMGAVVGSEGPASAMMKHAR